MIVLNLEQGSPEWPKARLGVATASNFDKIITPTGKPSTQSDAYALKLVAEWLAGENLDEYGNQWMQRGTELEPQARAFYEFQTGATVEQVGFVLRDDRKVGCSPDGLVLADGLVEIKCPAPHTHVDYLLTGTVPNKYQPQVQGQMMVMERDWCDFLSFHPLMPPVLTRVGRDEKFIKALNTELEKLLEKIESIKSTLRERGITESNNA